MTKAEEVVEALLAPLEVGDDVEVNVPNGIPWPVAGTVHSMTTYNGVRDYTIWVDTAYGLFSKTRDTVRRLL